MRIHTNTLTHIQEIYFDVCDKLNGESLESMGYDSEADMLKDFKWKLERIEIEFKTLANINEPSKTSISADDDDLLLKLPEVLKLVPMSRSHWSKGVASGKFPAPVRLSERCIAWRASTIRAFIANL
jgi:predicted DNA-binding transcriptional regulator AlpA